MLGGQQVEHRASFKAKQQLLDSPRLSGLRKHGLSYQSINILADGQVADGRMEAINCNSPLNSSFSAPFLPPRSLLGSIFLWF